MENIFIKKNFKLISLLFLIISFIMMIMHNIKMDSYIKYFIIPCSLLIISFIYLIRKFDIDKNKKYYLLLIPIILILFSYLIIDIDNSNMILNVIVIPVVLSMLFIGTTNDNYVINRDFIKNFFRVFPGNLFSNLSYLKLVKEDKKKRNNNLLYIIIGFIIGLPIVSIILSLLTSGDAYFNVFTDKVFGFMSNLFNIDNIICNILVIVISFIILFSVFVNILKNRFTKNIIKERKNVNSYIVGTILVMINFVFVLFLISEISKLTVNFLHVPIEYTYAEYAREGFFELLGVTVINMIIIGYLSYYTYLVKENKLIKVLVLLLCLFSIVLIFNSYYRMFLYINRFGFTILRSQVILFLLMELFIFLIIGKKIKYGIKYSEGKLFTIIIITTYIINLYLCNDTFINFINGILNY